MSAPNDNYHAAWRVLWWDWRNHHDWVGRRHPKKGGNLGYRRKAPPGRHAQDFLTREGAEAFVAKLRREIPEGELVVQFVSLRNLLALPAPEEWLPGPWPLQRQVD